jgi:hypothetical protein
LANKHDIEVVETLVEIGMADPIVVNEHGHQEDVKIHHHYFHPKKHIPKTMSSDDCNMSPVEGKTFSVLRSMHNCQSLMCTNGTNKYVCKYVMKIDASNYVVFWASPYDAGKLMSQNQFLHNIKVGTSEYNEKKAFEKSKLIGVEDDDESLKLYCNELLVKYIKSKLVHYPNGYRLTGCWIIVAKQLLENVIIHDEIQITDMPPVLQSYLDNYKNEKVENMLMCLKMDMLDTTFGEMDVSVMLHSIPEKSVFLGNAGTSDDGQWDGIEMVSKIDLQS